MASIQTTRGQSFDPKECARQRRESRREQGRRLDQVERCYREHTPKQQRSR